jgi:hypothetical protein
MSVILSGFENGILEGERRTLLRAFRSEQQPAELKDGGHKAGRQAIAAQSVFQEECLLAVPQFELSHHHDVRWPSHCSQKREKWGTQIKPKSRLTTREYRC